MNTGIPSIPTRLLQALTSAPRAADRSAWESDACLGIHTDGAPSRSTSVQARGWPRSRSPHSDVASTTAAMSQTPAYSRASDRRRPRTRCAGIEAPLPHTRQGRNLELATAHLAAAVGSQAGRDRGAPRFAAPVNSTAAGAPRRCRRHILSRRTRLRDSRSTTCSVPHADLVAPRRGYRHTSRAAAATNSPRGSRTGVMLCGSFGGAGALRHVRSMRRGTDGGTSSSHTAASTGPRPVDDEPGRRPHGGGSAAAAPPSHNRRLDRAAKCLAGHTATGASLQDGRASTARRPGRRLDALRSP